MGTRSRIGIRNSDGTITSVYCHWDGYLSHNGELLLKHWSDEKKLRKLMKMGDMSVLGEDIGNRHSFDNPDTRGYSCTFYKRDRGETDVDAQTHAGLDDFLCVGEEYNYVFHPDEGVWGVNYYKTGDSFRALTAALEESRETKAKAGAD